MLKSAATIESYFASMGMVAASMDFARGMRAMLGAIGRSAERAMFRATGGTNSHKGAIWILGLLVSAANRIGEPRAQEVASLAGCHRTDTQRQAALGSRKTMIASRMLGIVVVVFAFGLGGSELAGIDL